MQQMLGLLNVRDLVAVNEMVAELQKLQPLVSFCSSMIIRNIVVTTVTNASHCGNNETFGQAGLVCWLNIGLDNGSVFHGIYWSSLKQQKICFSLFGAEILIVADGDDRGYSVKTMLLAQFPI